MARDSDESPLRRPHSRAELQEWLERMGVRGVELGQDIENLIQPGITLDDVSHLAPPLTVPTAGADAFIIGAVGQFATITLQPAAAGGGIWLVEVAFRAGGNAARVFTTTVDTLLAPVVVVPAITPTGAPTALLRTGQRALGPLPGPLFAAGDFLWQPQLYIPPGIVLNISSIGVGVTAVGVNIYWQEVP